MHRTFLLLLGLLALTQCTKLTEDDCTYRAGLVSYHPITDGDGPAMAEANAHNYQRFIKDASDHYVDIVVFPEYGLTSIPKDGQVKERAMDDVAFRAFFRDTASRVPDPEAGVIICEDENGSYAESLKMVSCAARENKIYVVVNHLEKVDCREDGDNCPSDHFLLYNSQVVFDRDGRVVSRYRKHNLFNEPGVNVTSEAEFALFDTDFGVTFGTFICFDVLNEEPATWYLRRPDVENVVYSTHWFNENPFHHAAQTFGGWAASADVNFLVSGYSDSPTHSGGIGVFFGSEGAGSYLNPTETTNALLVVRVPKHRRASHPCTHLRPPIGTAALLRYDHNEMPTRKTDPEGSPLKETPLLDFQEDMRNYTSELVQLNKETRTTLCNNNLCCDFHVFWKIWDVEIEKMAQKGLFKTYSFRMVVRNGVRLFNDFMEAGIEICAVVACAGPELEDCSSRWDRKKHSVVFPAYFAALSIDRKFVDNIVPKRYFYMPTSIRSTENIPLDSSDYKFSVTEHGISTRITEPESSTTVDLLAFGIYGRRFNRDIVYKKKPKHAIAEQGSGEKEPKEESQYCHQNDVDGCVLQ